MTAENLKGSCPMTESLVSSGVRAAAEILSLKPNDAAH